MTAFNMKIFIALTDKFICSKFRNQKHFFQILKSSKSECLSMNTSRFTPLPNLTAMISFSKAYKTITLSILRTV